MSVNSAFKVQILLGPRDIQIGTRKYKEVLNGIQVSLMLPVGYNLFLL